MQCGIQSIKTRADIRISSWGTVYLQLNTGISNTAGIASLLMLRFTLIDWKPNLAKIP
jgi:hypothetical protein